METEPTDVAGYRIVTGKALQLEVAYERSWSDDWGDLAITELDSEVGVFAFLKAAGRGRVKTADLRYGVITITFREPRDDRRVVDRHGDPVNRWSQSASARRARRALSRSPSASHPDCGDCD